MEENKHGWKKRISWMFIIIILMIIYKLLDNFSGVSAWFAKLFGILKPFFIGILIAYILFVPCRAIERALQKTKSKFLNKRARGLSVLLIYIIAFLVIMIITNFIFPVLKESVVELVSNAPNYYNTVIEKYNELPEDNVLKNDVIKEKMAEFENIDIKQILNISNDKLLDYVKNIVGVFSGLFNIFVSLVVSVYVLLQRRHLVGALRKFSKAIFNEKAFEAIDKYFLEANEVFFTFIGSQVLDAFIVGIMTTVAMLIMKVQYAPLLGFIIGLFNLIPYIGAIVAVAMAVVITFITGGLKQMIIMAIVVIILQQIDANIINPKILGNNLKTSPLLVLFSISIGGAYFGPMGMFLAVPVAVVIKLILKDFVDNRNKVKEQNG